MDTAPSGESFATTWEEDQRRIFLDAATNGMLVVDASGTIELANAEAERIFGYPAGALAGTAVDRLESDEIRAALGPLPSAPTPFDPLQSRARRGDPTGRRADGTLISIDVVMNEFRTRGGRRFLVSVTDVMERRRARERRMSGDFPVSDAPELPSAEMPAIVGGFRFDLRRNDLAWSAKAARVYGLLPTSRPTLGDVFAAAHPDDRLRVHSAFNGVVTNGVACREELRVVRPDGSVRYVVLSGEAQHDPAGSIVAVAGSVEDVTERRNARAVREQLKERMTVANQAGKVGVWELDLQTNVSVWDKNMFSLYGLPETNLAPSFDLWSAALHPHDRERAVREVKDDIAQGVASDSEFRVVWRNGDIHYIRSLATIVCDTEGVPQRIIGTDWDVTEVRTLAAQLRQEKEALVSSEARYRALTEAMPQLVWVIDAEQHFEYVNDRWSRYTGLTLEESRAADARAVINLDDAALIAIRRAQSPHQEFECEVRLRRADDVYRWHLLRTVPFADATGDVGKWIVTATDIEERKAAERTLALTVAELNHLAHHDAMTNLPNRKLLMSQLGQAIAVAERSGSGVIVFYLDLNRFKWINDTFGHASGDRVLAQTGSRIAASLRAGDMASRVGGDEFIVVCATSLSGDEHELIAERLLAAIGQPIDIGCAIVTPTASIGVSVFPADGSEPDDLIRKADAAMYGAKQHGRAAFRRYDGETDISIVAAGEFEAELRHAIAFGELVVHYQPIISARSMFPIGAEALVRWQHPKRGLLPPGEFITFAEERGLIGQIGEIVLQSACQELKRLNLRDDEEFTIAVNVSAQQFDNTGFVESIVKTLALHGTDARRIDIEITESIVMGKTRAAIATLHELRALGVNLSIDDFGTGYSSLAYIKNFPIDTLKIDRSFVRDIADDATDQAIAKTIITLAHSLGMRVIAEGVETRAQQEKLKAFGSDSFQGYLLGRPMAAEDFERYMRAFARRRFSVA